MSDLALTSFLRNLKRTIDAHKDREERQLAVGILMWLCIAQRPLHPHEVLNIFVDHPRVSAWVEENLGQTKPARLTARHDYTVEPFLNDLLSDTVRMIFLNGGRVVELSCAAKPSDLNTQTAILTVLGLSPTESHRCAAEHCMNICSKGALQLVGKCKFRNNASILAYAWTYWDTHLSLAGNIPCSSEASAMIHGVAADVLALLICISELLSEPMRTCHTGKHIETVALIQQAQKAIERPLALLAALVDDWHVSEAVMAVRTTLEDGEGIPVAMWQRLSCDPVRGTVPRNGRNGSGSRGNVRHGRGNMKRQDFRAVNSAADKETRQESWASLTIGAKQKTVNRQAAKAAWRSASLESKYQRRAARTHSHRSRTHAAQRSRESGSNLQEQPLLTETLERAVLQFREIAQGLRHVCLSLAHPTLHGMLLQGLDDAISPMHILAKTAELLDKITAYATYQKRRSDDRPLADEPFKALDSTNNVHLASRLVCHYLTDHYDSEVARSCDVCKAVRITSAGTVSKPDIISSVRWYAAMAVACLKCLRKESRGSGPTNPCCSCSDRPTSSFSSLPTDLYMPAASLSKPTSFARLKSAVLSSGYRAALTQALAAIVLYHVRRFFAPWLGAFLFHNPMDDFRLAISRPHALLQETLSFPWTDACFSFLQRSLFDIAALITMNAVSANNGRSPIGILSRPTAHQDAIMCLAKIICWFYGFVTLEYIFCRSMNTVSLLVSVAKLATGGQDGVLALLAPLQTHWTKVPIVVLLTRQYIHQAFIPVIKGSISSAERGHASLLCAMVAVVGGVIVALQLRWKLGFLWLELSNFLAVVVMFVIVMVLLGYEFVRDPIGIANSTAWAKERAEEAHNHLTHEEFVKRLEIIRREDGNFEAKDCFGE